MTDDDAPPEDLWINASDLYRLLKHRHPNLSIDVSSPEGVRVTPVIGPSVESAHSYVHIERELPDAFGMYLPNMTCLRQILRGDPDGCEYETVRMKSGNGLRHVKKVEP